MKVYINGKYYGKDEAVVPVFDHGLLYGDGVFEGIRVYGGEVFKLREHLRRLYESARCIVLDIPMAPEELEAAVLEAVGVNAVEDGYIRLIVTRGTGGMGLDPASCEKPTVIIIAGGLRMYPGEAYQKGIGVVTASSRRIPHDCLEPRVKSLNYLNNVLAKIEARRAGCLEAVMLNTQGYVAECTADNIFIVKDGGLLTPPPHMGALDGITMRTVLEIASSMGIRSAATPLTRYDLYTAEECFLSGTGAEIVPVVEIDGRSVGRGGPGRITERLMAGFREHVGGLRDKIA